MISEGFMKRFISIFMVLLIVLCLFVPVTAIAEETSGQEKIQGDYGVDLSVWNVGGSKVMDYSLIDFKKAKESGCEYAILRIGFEGSSTREDTLDLAFLEYYKMAREAGMKLGIYFYALATTYDEAVNDAEWVIKVIEDNNLYFEYPLYYDVETGPHYALSKAQMTSLCNGWCQTLEKAGYYGGVYGRADILNKLDDEFKSKYSLWLRYIKTDSPLGQQYDPDTLDKSADCHLWQYTMFQKFAGIQNDELDGNFCYINYAEFMAENGYNNYTMELYNQSEGIESEEDISFEGTESLDPVSDEAESAGNISVVGIVLIAAGAVIGLAVVIVLIVVFCIKRK